MHRRRWCCDALRVLRVLRVLPPPLLLLGFVAACSGGPETAAEPRSETERQQQSATKQSSKAKQPASESAPSAEQLARVQNLIRANVLGLAEEILTTRGPPIAPTTTWFQWERQWWALYREQGRWGELHRRAAGMPEYFPDEFRRQAWMQAVGALIALGRGGEARQIIRQQLLAAAKDSPPPEQYARQLRRALVSAYLTDDLLDDARIAMKRFGRDYGPRETDWLLLSAGVLLRTGESAGAINLLAPLDEPAAQLLRLYARLNDGSLKPKEVIGRTQNLLKASRGRKSKAALRYDAYAVIARAYRLAEWFYSLVDGLEKYLLTPPKTWEAASVGVYPRFETKDLFAAYARIARKTANQARLLVGDEAGWLAHARKLPAEGKSDKAVARRALFAYVADTAAADSKFRQDAVDGYVNALMNVGRSALIPSLFGEDRRLGPLSLGGETGLRLSARAIERGNFQLAADVNANLKRLPKGVEYNDWLLQAARIDILAGRHYRGVEKLTKWLAAHPRLTAKQADAILQPIFDLQTVQRHELALELLSKVEARAPTDKHRREIAYWQAESYDGLGRHHQAADLYLHSALQQANGFDLWGEAARFRAAEALVNAGLPADARGLFEDILSRTTDEARRQTLARKLQRLRLLESSHEQGKEGL